MNCIHLNFVSDKEGRKFLFPILPQDGLNEKTLNVVITDGDSQRIYPVFQQKAGIYGDYSEYMTRHGCACCSLTTALAAFVEKYADLKPNGTISEVERKHFPEEVYTENYGKVMARQMPVSLYGISLILQEEGVSCEYIGDFEDKAAEKQMMEHLYKGKPVIIETSRMRRKGKRIVHFFDKKYAGSYHTMILFLLVSIFRLDISHIPKLYLPLCLLRYSMYSRNFFVLTFSFSKSKYNRPYSFFC